MKRTIIIFTVAAALVLSAGLLFAKNGPTGPGGKAGGTGQGDRLQTQEREMLKTQDGDCICYETKDGKLWEWKNSYNYQLKNFEKEDDEQGLHRYLRDVAYRYRLGNASDVDGFVEWALKNRPWNIE
jgi:hypothetical protein